MAEFSVKRSARDGQNFYCKKCEVVRVAAYTSSRPGHAARKSAYDKARNIKKADEIRTKSRARYALDSAKRVMAAAVWAKENPEARRAIANAYKGRRRAQCEAGMSGRELRLWLREQMMICSYCAAWCDRHYQVDHIAPLSRGGHHAEDNLTIACPTCNGQKSNKSLLFFLLGRKVERNTVTSEIRSVAA